MNLLGRDGSIHGLAGVTSSRVQREVRTDPAD